MSPILVNTAPRATFYDRTLASGKPDCLPCLLQFILLVHFTGNALVIKTQTSITAHKGTHRSACIQGHGRSDPMSLSSLHYFSNYHLILPLHLIPSYIILFTFMALRCLPEIIQFFLRYSPFSPEQRLPRKSVLFSQLTGPQNKFPINVSVRHAYTIRCVPG